MIDLIIKVRPRRDEGRSEVPQCASRGETGATCRTRDTFPFSYRVVSCRVVGLKGEDEEEEEEDRELRNAPRGELTDST